MRPHRLGFLLTSLMSVVLAGCVSSDVRQGGSRAPMGGVGRVFLAPIHNATPDETAGRAVTELAATTLLSHGVPLAQTEDSLNRSRALIEEGKAAQILELARSLQCTHVLLGTVTEYRYKSDLDGSPIVSITMRLVDAADGATVWQGTSTKMTQYFGSLSRTAQEAMQNLVQQMSGRSAGASRAAAGARQPGESEIEAAIRNAPPGSSHIPASTFRRGKYEPDVEQIRRRGDQ
ncbi:MAG: hypothetical protein HZA89_13250 [Verrucomicrobia bacterium]|nr:hypothetical protein [Verrucomicrobiota bacterium]